MDFNILDKIDKQRIGAKLKEARKKRGLTQAEAAAIIDVARTTITAIEKGERQIKEGELIRLARAYGRQVSDFVRERPAVESFAVQFRSAVSRTADDDDVIAGYVEQFEQLCQDYLELENLAGAPLNRKYPQEYQIDRLPLDQSAADIAQRERNRLGLGDGPIPQLRELLEQDVGLRIFYMKIKPSNKFSAMYTYDQQLGGCIAINRLHPEGRRRLSLAHDYAHFLVHRHQSEVLELDGYQRKPASERFADCFAIHFLMPANGVTRRFNDIRQSQGKVTPADLCILAHYFGVSVEAMTRRLEDLKLLPAGTWDRLKDSGFRIREAQQELGLDENVSNDDLLPKRYQFLAAYAYQRELITEGQLADFLRVDRIQAREIAARLRAETGHMLEEATLDLST